MLSKGPDPRRTGPLLFAMEAHQDNRHGLILAVTAANLFSSKVLLVKLAYAQGAAPMQVLGLRMAAALPFFAAIALNELWRGKGQRPTSRDYLGMSCLGLVGYYLASTLDFHGIAYLTSSMERLLLYLYPSFVVVIRSLVQRTRPTGRELAALGLAYLGLAMVYWDEHLTRSGDVLLGAALVLGSSLSFAIYLYFSSHYVKKVGSRFFASYSTRISFLAIILHSLLAGGEGAVPLNPGLILIGLAIAIFCTVLPTLAMHKAVSLVGSARVAILGTSGIVAPMVVGTLLFAEPLTPLRLLGTALILASVVLLGRK